METRERPTCLASPSPAPPKSSPVSRTPIEIQHAANLFSFPVSRTPAPPEPKPPERKEISKPVAKSSTVSRTPIEIQHAANLFSEPVTSTINGDEGEVGDVKAGQAQWLKSANERLLEPRSDPHRHQQQPCTIYRVPNHIRACSPTAYKPKLIPIGMFHNKPYTSESSDACKLKRRCLRLLLARHLRSHSESTDTALLETCLTEMKALVPRVKECYSDSDQLFKRDDNEFAEMLLLDACFILHLLLKQANNVRVTDGDEHVVLGKLWIWSLAEYDLLLVENQIPFFTVRRLLELLRTPDDANISLVDLALKLFSNLYPRSPANHPPISEENVHHLLHLFYLSLLPYGGPSEPVPPAPTPEWIPCVSELREAGVKYKKKRCADRGFLDVTFSDGTVEIPQLVLCDYSEPLFRNLVAFEQCYPDTGAHVTLYATFMDFLVSSPGDARLLQRKGIVVNRMSTDREGNEFFARVCDQAHYASDANYLRSVYVELSKCYQSRRRRWQARLVRDHCSNPWMIVSAVAASVLLLMTAAQTFFTIYPYFHPPK